MYASGGEREMKKGKKKEKGQRGEGLKEQEPGTESIGCSDLSIHAFQVSPDFILFFPPLRWFRSASRV